MMPAAVVKLQTCNRHGGALKLHRRGAFGEVSNALLQPVSPANPPIAETGTGIAISYLCLGVAAILPVTGKVGEADAGPAPSGAAGRFREARPARGGARNFAQRESRALTTAHLANLKAAERHAALLGLTFTRMLTIHWQASGAPLVGMARATGRFLDLMTKWLGRKGHRITWLWVAENGEGKGWHVHILAHVSAATVKELTGNLRRWLRLITGQPYRKSVILSRPIGGRLGLERGNPELHAVNLQAAFGYVCKGAPQAALDEAGIDRSHQPGGRVIGKRCGTSQNIGAKARATGVDQ